MFTLNLPKSQKTAIEESKKADGRGTEGLLPKDMTQYLYLSYRHMTKLESELGLRIEA